MRIHRHANVHLCMYVPLQEGCNHKLLPKEIRLEMSWPNTNWSVWWSVLWHKTQQFRWGLGKVSCNLGTCPFGALHMLRPLKLLQLNWILCGKRPLRMTHTFWTHLTTLLSKQCTTVGVQRCARATIKLSRSLHQCSNLKFDTSSRSLLRNGVYSWLVILPLASARVSMCKGAPTRLGQGHCSVLEWTTQTVPAFGTV